MQHDNREDLISRNMLLNLSNSLGDPLKLPDMNAYHNARKKVISKVTNDGNLANRLRSYAGEYYYKWGDEMTRAKIHVFCPPLLQYVYFALALASADHSLKTCEFQLVIHPDDRLLDSKIYSVEEGHESILQLDDFVRSHAELGEPADTFQPGVERESRCRFLATRFDQVWMDQRITDFASDKPAGDKIDASKFFKVSKETLGVPLIVIMAGSQVCDDLTRTAPLAGPDNAVQPSQIYRLEELAGVNEQSLFRWKTRHFCRINSP